MGSFPPMGRRGCGPFCGFYRIFSDPQRSAAEPSHWWKRTHRISFINGEWSGECALLSTIPRSQAPHIATHVCNH
eukprot:1055497-Prorocentrum_minimum.AAC.1